MRKNFGPKCLYDLDLVPSLKQFKIDLQLSKVRKNMNILLSPFFSFPVSKNFAIGDHLSNLKRL